MKSRSREAPATPPRNRGREPPTFKSQKWVERVAKDACMQFRLRRPISKTSPRELLLKSACGDSIANRRIEIDLARATLLHWEMLFGWEKCWGLWSSPLSRFAFDSPHCRSNLQVISLQRRRRKIRDQRSIERIELNSPQNQRLSSGVVGAMRSGWKVRKLRRKRHHRARQSPMISDGR
jgi:hypothetical protein